MFVVIHFSDKLDAEAEFWMVDWQASETAVSLGFFDTPALSHPFVVEGIPCIFWFSQPAEYLLAHFIDKDFSVGLD